MTDDDPVPLKAGGEASPELVRALYALGKSGPDAARLARVAEKLGTALTDAPPPGTGSSSGVRKLFGIKTLITGIVVGLAALSWLGYQLAGRHENDKTAPAKPPQPAAVEVSSRELPPSQVREAEPPHAAVVAPAPQPLDAVGYAGAVRRSGRRAKPSQGSALASSGSSASSAASQPVAVAPAVTVAPAATDTREARSDTEKAQPKPPELPAPPKPQSIAPRSEVELLFDARKAMPAQPEAALRILDEHAARFPSGLLAPEREVLRIEALRKLGRGAEASQRLHQFESRYPDSIHLRRLQADASSSL
jgi:hypothetical protein